MSFMGRGSETNTLAVLCTNSIILYVQEHSFHCILKTKALSSVANLEDTILLKQRARRSFKKV